MAGFGSKFRSLFLEDDADAQKQQGVVASPSIGSMIKIQEKTPPVTNTNTDSPSQPESNEIDQDILNTLTSALEKSTYTGGSGYFDFLRFFRSFDNIISDEETKVKSAIAAGKSVGLTPESLMQSFEFYFSILKNEETKFLKSVSEKTDTDINSKKTALNEKDKLIQLKQEQIRQLESEIAQLNDEKGQLSSSIDQEEHRVAKVKENFYRTYQVVLQSITADKERINKYVNDSSLHAK